MTYGNPTLNLASPAQIEIPIKIAGLTKSYGTVGVLENFDLVLDHKECLGIIGPNGAGKTTLFRCLMGLVRIQQGNINLLGQSVVTNGKISPQLRRIRPRIGYVPESLEIYSFLTVREYLCFISKLFVLREDEYNQYSRYLIRLFELEEWEESLIKHLSTGNYQKLILCTALIHQPEVLILDEPFSNLDIKTRKKTKNILKKFISRGIPELDIDVPGSIIIASHILADLEELCTQIALLHSGRITWKGTIAEIRQDQTKARSFESFVLEVWDNETEKDWQE
ncbi:MAG: ABC transporter ATP-binding protein [Candidatus Heimdallarchaeota archaeon]